MDYSINAKKMRQQRILQGMSVTELATNSGVTRLSIYKIEQEKVLPRPKTLKKLCTALGLEVREVCNF